jgi:hypothetical protein
MSRIARVVWAANDPEYGALHTLYDGGLYPALFTPLLLIAAPEPTIADRASELMQQWIADPKRQKTEWTEKQR